MYDSVAGQKVSRTVVGGTVREAARRVAGVPPPRSGCAERPVLVD